MIGGWPTRWSSALTTPAAASRRRRTDVLVVGAGPSGASAAAWAARAGRDVVLADAAVFPRDKTCGDGLTPRAIAELDRLGLGDWVRDHTVNQGLRAHGFGQTLLLPWPGGSLPDHGSAVPRTELDDRIRTEAIDAGATGLRAPRRSTRGSRAGGSRRSRSPAATRRSTSSASGSSWPTACAAWARCSAASGTRTPSTPWPGAATSTPARPTTRGSAATSSCAASEGEALPGYGWIFPLGGGQVNVGVGALATTKRPADIAIKPLMKRYTDERRADFGLTGEQRMPTSALLPMGGAVSNVAGANWALIGDAAACVNPLNGEGIDYGLETGRLVVDHLDTDLAAHLAGAARRPLRRGVLHRPAAGRHLHRARDAGALGPVGMRSDWLMTLALRWMGNLVTDEDRDRSARVWRWAGRVSSLVDPRPPFSAQRPGRRPGARVGGVRPARVRSAPAARAPSPAR